MRSIWKFPFDVADTLTLYVPGPDTFKPVFVGMQQGRPTLWAEVDTEAPPGAFPLLIRGTGHELQGNEDRHVGTFFSGPFVWHVYTAKPTRSPA